MKTLVLSGINLYEGGPLTIYKDVLSALVINNYLKDYHIIAFVHKKNLFDEFENTGIQFIELPKSRKSYIMRLYYEYIWFYRYSKKLTVEIWISLHDITPNVKANKLYTYCHNPTPFSKKNNMIKKYDKTVYYMTKFYKFLYGINIHQNTAVIVQQDWIRNEFKRRYHIDNVIVAKPVKNCQWYITAGNKNNVGKKVFIFPALARPFKNHQIICEAVKELEEKQIDFEVILTIAGNENKYAKDLYKQYGDLNNIKWLGMQTPKQIQKLYANSDCLIFPSILETWGLPISEYKATGKDMILVDLPYAHETLGTYDKVMFFQQGNKKELAARMSSLINNNPIYMKQEEKKLQLPLAHNWKELLNMIMPITLESNESSS